MNNKGFAITTILYGALILFLLLFSSMLGILATYNHRMELLTEAGNGARDIVTMKAESIASGEITKKRGYYYIGGSCYKYLSKGDTASCS